MVRFVDNCLFLPFQEFLPLLSFHYGYMQSALQKAAVEIGPLICEGLKPRPTFGSDCEAIESLGQPPGYYIVEEDNDLKIAKCNLSQSHEIVRSLSTSTTSFEASFFVEHNINPNDRLTTLGISKWMGISKSRDQKTTFSDNFEIPDGHYQVDNFVAIQMGILAYDYFTFLGYCSELLCKLSSCSISEY